MRILTEKQKKVLSGVLAVQLLMLYLFAPLAARAEDADPAWPSDPGGLNEFSYPSDPGGLDEFPSAGSGGGTGSGDGFSLGNLGGLLTSSGVSCGGGGGSGGFLGSIFGGALGKVGDIFGGFLGGSSGGSGALNTLGAEGASAAIASTPSLAGVSASDISGMTGSELGSAVAAGGITQISDASDIATGATGAGLSLDSVGGGGSAISGIGDGLGSVVGGIGSIASIAGGLLGGSAQVPVADSVTRNETGRIRTNTGEIVKKECVLDPISKAITAVLLKTLGNRIISWIQNSDVGFIKNYEMEFRKAEQERAEEFRRNLAKTQMGYGINAYVDNVLAYPKPGSNKLAETFTCPVPELRDGSFNADFDNGGWAALFKKFKYAQCNAEGSSLLALEEETALVNNKLRAQSAEINANSGFKGYGVETK